MTLKVFGDSTSGNCLKVKWVLNRLGVDYSWTEIDVRSGLTRKAEFLAVNPSGQVPAVVFDDGRTLSQSGAIMLHFAAGTDLIPADAFERSRMLEWMFWEQYSHEPSVAVRRYHLAYLKTPAETLDPKLFERGTAALERLELGLQGRRWLAGDRLSLADLALVAYTRMAGEGGFDLGLYPAVSAWVERVEAALGLDASTRALAPA